jgi:hypothetical protein
MSCPFHEKLKPNLVRGCHEIVMRAHGLSDSLKDGSSPDPGDHAAGSEGSTSASSLTDAAAVDVAQEFGFELIVDQNIAFEFV